MVECDVRHRSETGRDNLWLVAGHHPVDALGADLEGIAPELADIERTIGPDGHGRGNGLSLDRDRRGLVGTERSGGAVSEMVGNTARTEICPKGET